MKIKEIIFSLFILGIIYAVFFISLDSAFDKEFEFEDRIINSYRK